MSRYYCFNTKENIAVIVFNFCFLFITTIENFTPIYISQIQASVGIFLNLDFELIIVLGK